jgi:hypothetical protein
MFRRHRVVIVELHITVTATDNNLTALEWDLPHDIAIVSEQGKPRSLQASHHWR